mmetsp:Transcript_103858/g.332865  ORF Transcript_103858/g.332865 Transcript_103858/m.332865 type:complete len:373 (-) Transcript_103858:154-1272(-)
MVGSPSVADTNRADGGVEASSLRLSASGHSPAVAATSAANSPSSSRPGSSCGGTEGGLPTDARATGGDEEVGIASPRSNSERPSTSSGVATNVPILPYRQRLRRKEGGSEVSTSAASSTSDSAQGAGGELGNRRCPRRASSASGSMNGGSGGSGGLVFACTGVKLTERQQQGLVAVGTLSAECSPQVTHLVAKYLRRTVKLMCAICRGLAIVQPKYLDRCAAGGAASSRRCSRGPGGAPDERPDLLWDKDGEAAFARRLSLPGYALAPALRRARAYGPLLRGRAVRLLGPASCELRAALEAVVAAADGRWLREDSDDLGTPGDVLLLAENRAAAEQVVAAEPSVGRPIYLAEALLAAACSQELRLEPYRLVG